MIAQQQQLNFIHSFIHSFSIFHSFIFLLNIFLSSFSSFTSSSQLNSTESERKFVMGWLLRMEGSCVKSIMTIIFHSSSFLSLPFPLLPSFLLFYLFSFLIYLIFSIVPIFLSPYSSLVLSPPFNPFHFLYILLSQYYIRLSTIIALRVARRQAGSGTIFTAFAVAVASMVTEMLMLLSVVVNVVALEVVPVGGMYLLTITLEGQASASPHPLAGPQPRTHFTI